jgi:hypothetical protein
MLDGLIGVKNERLRGRAKDIGIAARVALSIAQRGLEPGRTRGKRLRDRSRRDLELIFARKSTVSLRDSCTDGSASAS